MYVVDFVLYDEMVLTLGPWGPGLVDSLRSDLQRRFQNRFEDNTITNYVYHLNVQVPRQFYSKYPASGEEAFGALCIPIAYAIMPLTAIFHELPQNIPIRFIYGRKTWMDIDAGYEIQQRLKETHPQIQVHELPGSHHRRICLNP